MFAISKIHSKTSFSDKEISVGIVQALNLKKDNAKESNAYQTIFARETIGNKKKKEILKLFTKDLMDIFEKEISEEINKERTKKITMKNYMRCASRTKPVFVDAIERLYKRADSRKILLDNVVPQITNDTEGARFNIGFDFDSASIFGLNSDFASNSDIDF